MAERRTKAWEVWNRDPYEGDFYVDSFRDKGEAERRIARLKRSHPDNRYFVKHRPVPVRMQFGRRHTRKSGREQAAVERRHQRDTSNARQARRHGSAPPKRHRPIARYFTIIVPRHHGGGYSPWTVHELPAGASSRSVGAFKSRAEAHAWAKSHLAGARYRLREFERGTYRGKNRYTSKSRPQRDVRSSRRRANLVRSHHHRSASAPPFKTQKKISRKIRLLREEGYPPKQAAAIAYRMYGASRTSAAQRSRRR